MCICVVIHIKKNARYALFGSPGFCSNLSKSPPNCSATYGITLYAISGKIRAGLIFVFPLSAFGILPRFEPFEAIQSRAVMCSYLQFTG